MEQERKYEILPLFSTPIYKSIIEEISEEEKSFIFNIEYEDIGNGLKSKNSRILEHPAMVSVKEKIQKEINFYIYKILNFSEKVSFHITTSWVMKHLEGHKAPAHTHLNSVMSGILYVDVPEESGGISFGRWTNRNVTIFPVYMDMEIKKYNIYNSESWSVDAKNNMVVLFPSDVPHFTPKSQSVKPRYCIAFNCFIKCDLGKVDIGKLII